MTQRVSIEKICALRPDFPGQLVEYLIKNIPYIEGQINEYINSHTEMEIQRHLDESKRAYERTMRLRDDPLGFGTIGTLYFMLALEEALKEVQEKNRQELIRAQEEADERARKIGEEIAKKMLDDYINAVKKEKEDLEKQKQEALQQKDKVIDEYKKTVATLEEAVKAKENLDQLTRLSTDFLRVAAQNEYLLNLIAHMPNPLDPILFKAVINSEYEDVKSAIKLGANINTQDSELNTALHKACLLDDIKMVRLLLANGCDSEKLNKAGKQAKEYASPKIAQLITDTQKIKVSQFKSNITLFSPKGNLLPLNHKTHAIKNTNISMSIKN